MLKNYLKIAVRNFLRHKAYSFINVTSLTLGIACYILMLLYMQIELSYDKYHQNAKRIYRIVCDEKNEGQLKHLTDTYAPLARAASGVSRDVACGARLSLQCYRRTQS
jgi:putative ABC transport system permease protein